MANLGNIVPAHAETPTLTEFRRKSLLLVMIAPPMKTLKPTNRLARLAPLAPRTHRRVNSTSSQIAQASVLLLLVEVAPPNGF
jgi:hypothetical protein